MVGEASGGSSFDGNVIIKQVGGTAVNSRVSADEETWGIPVDVNTSHRSYIKHTAASLFASAPLIEMDDNGNIKYVSESKVHQIAKECIKNANILHDELHAYKSSSGSSEDDGKTKKQLQQENATLKEANDALEEANKTNQEYIDSLEEKVKDTTDDTKVDKKYIETLEDKIKEDVPYIDALETACEISEKYVNALVSKLKASNITVPSRPTKDDLTTSDKSLLPSRPSSSGDEVLPTKPSKTEDWFTPSGDEVLPDKPSKDPDDPIKPTNKGNIAQINRH